MHPVDSINVDTLPLSFACWVWEINFVWRDSYFLSSNCRENQAAFTWNLWDRQKWLH